ncbi:MAG: hypothetical protein H0X33_01580 [Taibaiella sp.]|nr:hypothetical protein [Taibaiella sp.]
MFSASAQNKPHRFDHVNIDSLRISNHKLINHLLQQAVNSVRRETDTTIEDLTLNGKSEMPFLPYQGKIIRNIEIEALDFERSFNDTGRRMRSLASKLADATHTNTRNYVVRNNLFINENTPLNAYKVADNERYLRTLDYINDARIVVKPIKGNPDSVDLLVITKDFFSLSADFSSDVFNHIHTTLVDANLYGTGQRIEVSGLYDYKRHPTFGYGGLYRNNNIAHSFINGTVNYSNININSMTGEEETAYSINFSRPLVSPYSRFAGGLLASYNKADNIYRFTDSLFYKYTYTLLDGWIGYNIGIGKLSLENNKIRDRHFIGIRYLNYHYDHVPYQVDTLFNPVYNSRQGVLASFTFFRQDYYKTQYIYGFGTTEDLPYGYNVSVTGGYFRQLSLQRPYVGLNATRYIATPRGDFIQLFFRAGSFMYKGRLQDASVLFGATAFSRLFFINQTKVRQYLLLSYTHLHNPVTYAPLRINNGYGVRGFSSDSAYGDRRLTLQTETEFYLKYKVLGFKFAPFPYVDISLLTPPGQSISKTVIFPGLGGGVRARNENLVFETIELRFYYYPHTVYTMPGYKIVLTSNIRFRYNSNYVSAPDVVQLNVF